MTDIAIIVPTMNRSEFVRRQLAYYANRGCPHAIYVGDSSQGEHWDRTAEAVERLQGKIKVVHAALPGHNDTEAIMALLRLATERYAVFSGDDDFLVPNSLVKCARFLDTHSEFSLAHGVRAAIKLDVPGPYGRVAVGGTRYGSLSLERKSASERLKRFLPNAFSTNYSLQRREEFLSTMQCTTPMADRVFRELLPNSLRLVRGRARQLNCFYLVRQSLGGEHRPTGDVYDWVTSPDWLASYHIFRDVLAEALAQQDDIQLARAHEVVKEGLWSYLVNRLSKHWKSRYSPEASGLRARTRATVKNIPLAGKTWGNLRALKSPGINEIDLKELLRSSSRYHADFMPVHQAMAAPPAVIE